MEKTKILLLIVLLLLFTVPIFVFGQSDPELFPVNDRKVGYIGYYLEDGTNVVKPQFCSASYYTDGYYIVSKAEHEIKYDNYGSRTEKHLSETAKFGLLDSKGQFIINFDNNYSFISVYNGIITVSKNDFYGIVNEKNEILIPVEYEDLCPINPSVIVATKKNKMGIINTKNEIKVPFIYDKIFQQNEDIPISLVMFYDDIPYFIVKQGEKYGVINQKGEFIAGLNDDKIVLATKFFIVVEKDGKYGFIDYQQKVILPFKQYDSVDYYGGDEINFMKDNEKFIYNINGKFIRTEKFIRQEKY